MKKFLITVTAFCCLLLLGFVTSATEVTASSHKSEWESKWETLVAEGKKEGKVMIYGRGDPPLRNELRKVFTGKYGIELEFLYIPRSPEMVARIKKERGAGLYLADVVIHGTTAIINLMKPAGLIDPMEPLLILPEVTDPSVWRKGFYFTDKERMIKPLRASFMRYAIRNTNLVKEGELKSYWDLLDPKWKGRIVMGNPTRPGTANGFIRFLNGIWGRDKIVEYLKQLAKQEPVFSREIRLPLEWVSRGKYAIAVAARMEAIPSFMKLGAPLAVVNMTEGGFMAPGAGNITVVNKRPRPNATALFVNWILTNEGMTAWSKGDGHACARLDVSTDWVHPLFLAKPGERVWVDTEESLKLSSPLMKLAKEIFGPLLK